MSEDINRTIIYTFRMDDNVTEASRQAGNSARESHGEVQTAIQGQKEYQQEIRVTNDSLDAQQIKLASQVAILMGFKSATTGVINGVIQLGLVSDETAGKLRMVNSVFSIMGGLATGIKTLQLAMTSLNVASIKNALINTYNKVLTNPGAVALAGIGLGATAGALTYFGLQASNSTSTTNNNITIEAPASEGTAQEISEIYTVLNGGAL